MLKLRKVLPLLAALAVVAIVVVMLATSSKPQFARKHASDFSIAEPSAMIPDTANVQPPAMAAAMPNAGHTGASEARSMAPIAVSVPKLAYAYKLGFRIANDRLAAAQEAHVLLCEHMGPMRCQLLAMERGTFEGSETPARLKLRVASSEARRFSAALTRAVSQEGGRAIQTSVLAEDVSKAIVDAEARIRQREMLVARLTEILRSRRGSVQELVEAERSVAAAQEELDQTRGWLGELRARVAMSDFGVAYQAVTANASPATSRSRVGEALQGSVVVLATTAQVMVVLAIYLLPWGLIGLGAWLGWRRFGRRAVVAAAG